MGECWRGNYLLCHARVIPASRLILTNSISVFDSLVSHGLIPHVAWRVSFVTVPFVMLMTMAIAMLLFAPDTPTGPWKDRHLNRTIDGLDIPEASAAVVDVSEYDMEDATPAKRDLKVEVDGIDKKKELFHDPAKAHEASTYDITDVNFAEASLVKQPSMKLIFEDPENKKMHDITAYLATLK